MNAISFHHQRSEYQVYTGWSNRAELPSPTGIDATPRKYRHRRPVNLPIAMSFLLLMGEVDSKTI